LIVLASLVDEETLLELLWEAARVVVPPKELWSSVSEDEELGHLLEIDVGEVLGSGINHRGSEEVVFNV
jgi:hypothetical protein